MRKSKKRTWIGRILRWLLLALAAFLVFVVVYLKMIARDHPPEGVDLSILQRERIQIGDDHYAIGNNWIRKTESGLWECYIEGEPFERGAVFGMLTRELLYYQESVFVDQIRELVPSDTYLKSLKYFISYFNRDLEENIPDEYRREIYGTSLSCDSSFDFIGSGYQRQLNYHAAHDIGHALADLNFVACTSFSVWDEKSLDSSLITGRNFDFYMGDRFAENKIVCFVNPSAGYPFMMVTWADMIGVVSGMNKKGLTVTINAAKSSIPTRAFTPVTLVAREILQYASTIQEAYDIAQKRNMFVSESFMISSSADGKTAIIEKSPDAVAIVYPDSNRIVCTNHFQSASFANDERNVANINGSDSYERYLRVQELLDNSGDIDVQSAVAILRNQQGLNDQDIGMGNQLAVNQLIAHHSVVFKPDSLQVWVSSPPYQLGSYVAYNLKEVFSSDKKSLVQQPELYNRSQTIAADTFLFSTDYENYLQFRNMTAELNQYKWKKESFPASFAEDYIQLNPEFYLTYVHLGDYYRKMKDDKRAVEYYNMALTKKLPGLDEEKNITKLVEKLN